MAVDNDVAETDLDPEIERFISRVESRRSGSTKENRVSDAKDFGAWLNAQHLSVTDVNPPDVEDYISYLGNQEYAPVFINNRRWTLNILFDDLERRDLIDENPVEEVDWSRYAELLNGTKKAEYVEARGGIYALDRDGIETLVDHISAARGPTGRNTLMVLLMYHTGVRAQELADMKLENLDRDERRIGVFSKKLDSDHVRANPWRPVWYGPSLEKHMARWLDFGGRDALYPAADSDYLFCSQRSERVSERHINQVVRDAAESAGLQEVMYQDAVGNDRHRITSHTLRHSFAYECMQSTDGGGRIDLKTLAELMGHQDTQTTEKYLVFAEKDLRKSRRLYGPH